MPDVYSVWNWEKGQYDYYSGNRSHGYRSTVGYPASRAQQGLGEVPERSVQPLPAGVRYIGSGTTARGMVAAPSKRSGLVFAGLALGALALVW